MADAIEGIYERVLVRKDQLEALAALVAAGGDAHHLDKAVLELVEHAVPPHVTSQHAAGRPLEQTAGGQYTHNQVASRVRMLYRFDLDHEGVCLMARDRIVWLAARVAELEAAVEYARVEFEDKEHVARTRLEEGLANYYKGCKEKMADALYGRTPPAPQPAPSYRYASTPSGSGEDRGPVPTGQGFGKP